MEINYYMIGIEILKMANEMYPCPPYNETDIIDIDIEISYYGRFIFNYSCKYNLFPCNSRYYHVCEWVNTICLFLNIGRENIKIKCQT